MSRLALSFAVVFAAGAVVGTCLQGGPGRVAWHPRVHVQPERQHPPDYTMHQPFDLVGSKEQPQHGEIFSLEDRQNRRKGDRDCCDDKGKKDETERKAASKWKETRQVRSKESNKTFRNSKERS